MSNEPDSSKRYKLACSPIKDSDQPAHSCSLIRVFDWRSTCSQGSNEFPGWKLKLWSGCTDAQTDLSLANLCRLIYDRRKWTFVNHVDTVLIISESLIFFKKNGTTTNTEFTSDVTRNTWFVCFFFLFFCVPLVLEFTYFRPVLIAIRLEFHSHPQIFFMGGDRGVSRGSGPLHRLENHKWL